ncbi:MAG: SAM-dependent methyltransferase [Candidatus Eremiobacteraeota bacterium]|nr:SAM-dependent methyltransferase [Candidatus Eremiobacteraeota bacterium]
MAGALTIVGSGIQTGRDITRAASDCVRQADKVLYLATERVTTTWLRELNASAESLHRFYGVDKPRQRTYAEMVDYILSFVRAGRNVCVVCYGHPGVFADPMHESIRVARREGFRARLLPAISSIDWLYADLAVDPAQGCQIYEAADFLTRRPRFDPTSGLVLLQVGIIWEMNYPAKCNSDGFCKLAAYLAHTYDPDHEVVIYEAAQYSISDPSIQRIQLKMASRVVLSLASTLYVPPKGTSQHSGNE